MSQTATTGKQDLFEPTLELLCGDPPVAIFSSTGNWLHPLFELEDFLAASAVHPGECVLRDKLVGKAAALLIVRLGFRDVRAGLLSRLGAEVLVAHGVRFEAHHRVERILCRTEELLAEIDDPDEAYRILRLRIEQSRVHS